jgi:hypothetical protein
MFVNVRSDELNFAGTERREVVKVGRAARAQARVCEANGSVG